MIDLTNPYRQRVLRALPPAYRAEALAELVEDGIVTAEHARIAWTMTGQHPYFAWPWSSLEKTPKGRE